MSGKGLREGKENDQADIFNKSRKDQTRFYYSPFFCSLEMSLFPSIFVPLPFLFLYGEYIVRGFSPFRWCFSTL